MGLDVNITENIGKATEIVFIFDTTGSMSPCLANVRSHIEKTCEELFQDIPELKIGFIAHGDYCDGHRCCSILQLTSDQAEVFKFIREVPATGGGDIPECYELALHTARSMGWSKGGKTVVMIGDATPHEPDYYENKEHLDWRKELDALKEMNVNVYPLQCLYNPRGEEANAFWSSIAEICNTPLLKLQDFNEASQVMASYAFASSGSASFAAYELKLAAKGCCSENLSVMNSTLRGEATKYDNAMETI